MNGWRLGLGLLEGLIAMGCGAGDPQAGRYVLLDPQARAAGVTLQLGDEAVTIALPVEVPPQAEVRLLGPSRDESLPVAPGELVYVAGDAAAVRHLVIGKDVAIDRVRVIGDEQAARELASQLGGSAAPDDAGWRVEAPAVFAAAAAARVPAHLEGLAPVMLAATSPPTAAPPSLHVVATGAAPSQGVGPRSLVEPVLAPPGAPALLVGPGSELLGGIEQFRDARVVSPVAFSPAAAGCSGVGGTWRARVYSDPHLAYYDFTLDVAQHGTFLQGKMVVEFWDANPDEVEPPSSCHGTQHLRVVERATGAIDPDGTMRFLARGWQVSHHLCGEKVVDYSLDRVEVRLARDATTAEATISDDVVWVDGMPAAITRVRCEGG
jgi:hypothetical protein